MSEAGGPVDGGEGGDDDETMKLCIKERRMSEAGGPVDGGEGGDDDETMKLCIKIVSEAALACEGYVTKTSNGVSLLAFPTPDDGMRFIVAVRSAIESEGALKFC